MMDLDFNNADQQMFDLIPANTIVKLHMTIRPGNFGHDENMMWLTKSNSSDAAYLNAEFTVVEGRYARRKLWTNMTVMGGKTNAQGESIAANITKATLRAIIESARNINPTDMSPKAIEKRKLKTYGDFNGMEFIAKIGIDKDKTGTYGDKNKILAVITPGSKDYKAYFESPAFNNGGQNMTYTPPAQNTQAWAQQGQPATTDPKPEDVAPWQAAQAAQPAKSPVPEWAAA